MWKMFYSCLLWFCSTGLALAAWTLDTSTNIPVCTAENDQHFPTLAPDAEGGCFVFWQDARRGNRDIYAQHLNAEGDILWDLNGIPLCTEDSAQGWPEAISDNSGGAIVLWGEARHGSQDIYAQRVDANGDKLWASEGIPVCVDPALQENIVLIPDGEGGVIAAWEDWRNGNQDIYAQRIAPDGTMLWGENGIAVCQIPGDQYDPVLVNDGEGGAVVVWWDISTPDWDIYAQRISATGEKQWNETGMPVCTVAGNQGGPLAVSDGQGGAIVAWVDYRMDPIGDLYAQHLGADGNQQWDADGVPICTLQNAQQQPTAISDGQGGIILTWWDERDIYSDIYAQRVNADGTPLWQENGLPICLAEGMQREPRIIVAENGACIFWKDYREDYAMVLVDHIYAQRVDQDGNILWEPNGLPVTTADAEQSEPEGIWIPTGLVVSWMDQRNGEDSDIYIQWIPGE